MGGLSIWHWLLVLVIVVLIFGTRKLKDLGKDLGDAVRNFKQAVTNDDKSTSSSNTTDDKSKDNQS